MHTNTIHGIPIIGIEGLIGGIPIITTTKVIEHTNQSSMETVTKGLCMILGIKLASTQCREHLTTTGQDLNTQEGTMTEEMNSSTTCQNSAIIQTQGSTMVSSINSKDLLNHPVSQRTFLHKGQSTFVHFATKLDI